MRRFGDTISPASGTGKSRKAPAQQAFRGFLTFEKGGPPGGRRREVKNQQALAPQAFRRVDIGDFEGVRWAFETKTTDFAAVRRNARP